MWEEQIIDVNIALIRMFFPDQQHQISRPDPIRTLFVYQNSAPWKKPVELQLPKKKINFKQLSRLLNMSPLRLFNSEGAEYFEDDLEFIKNKTALYASRGQQFDTTSCFGEYQMIELLGQGGFGKVFLAKHKQTDQRFAIKIIKTEKICSAGQIDCIFTEAEVLKTLKHDNIVSVHNCLTLKNMEVAIIMEYLGGGQLLALVEKQNYLSQDRARNFIRQIVKGMVYCHQHNLIHRDLKLQNVLLVNGNEDRVKIIDFGIAGVMNFLTWEDMDTGSLAYMAPECFINSKNYKVDGRIDVWAVGIILYCLVTGTLPFKGATTMETVEAIKNGKFKIPADKQKKLSQECIDLINLCLTLDSKVRPTMEQLASHPWIAPKKITQQSLQQLQKSQELPQIEQDTKIPDSKHAKTQKPKEIKMANKKPIYGGVYNKPKPPSKAFK